MGKRDLLNTREVAELLDINEKVVYSLINEKGLPATKITGKWLFPRHLVEQWLENSTVNFPRARNPLPPYEGLLIINGSNDVLLDRMISYFNKLHPEHVAVFGNVGSMGGIRSLRRNLCHIASSHLLQDDETDYNFGFTAEELDMAPAVVNFCQRQQGIVTAKGNPKGIETVADLIKGDVRIVNRPTGTGTRLLLDREIKKAGIKGDDISGYYREIQRHMDVGLEVLSGRVDAGPCIKAVAGMLDLAFIPLRWERFDFIISRERFFDQGIQLFLGLLRDPAFHEDAESLEGYDLSRSGEMLYPIGDN